MSRIIKKHMSGGSHKIAYKNVYANNCGKTEGRALAEVFVSSHSQ